MKTMNCPVTKFIDSKMQRFDPLWQAQDVYKRQYLLCTTSTIRPSGSTSRARALCVPMSHVSTSGLLKMIPS